MRTIPVLTDKEKECAIEVAQMMLDMGIKQALLNREFETWQNVYFDELEFEGVSIGAGCTKVVFLDEQNPRWVIKMDWVREDTTQHWCQKEAKYYQEAFEQHLEECFAVTQVLTTIDDVVFTIQERVDVNEDNIDSRFETYITSGIYREDYDSDEAYERDYENALDCIDDEDRVIAMMTENEFNLDTEDILQFLYNHDINDLHCGNWGITSEGYYIMIDYSGY
jgi:hypothetical protein